MTTPTGQISLGNVRDEFGASAASISGSAVSLGNYRINQTIAGLNWTLDEGVPSSGEIRMSQLRGKTLNVVVDYSGANEYYTDSRERYDLAGIVVGGFRTRPTSTSSTTKKVHHVIRKKIGGAKRIGRIARQTPASFSKTGGVFGQGGYTVNPRTVTAWGPDLTTQNLGQEQWKKVGNRFQWVPPTGSFIGETTTTTYSPNLPIIGGGVGGLLSIRKDQIRYGYRQGTKNPYTYYIQTLDVYYPTLVSGGSGYSRREPLSVTWNGKTFKTFVPEYMESLGPAFRTGSGWGGIVALNYIIRSTGAILGSGGDGGDVLPGTNKVGRAGGDGGIGFGVQHNCNITIESGGVIRGGAGGGGGGGFDYDNTNSGDARAAGGGGGGGAGFPAGAAGCGGVQSNTDFAIQNFNEPIMGNDAGGAAAGGGGTGGFGPGSAGSGGSDLSGGSGGSGGALGNARGGAGGAGGSLPYNLNGLPGVSRVNTRDGGTDGGAGGAGGSAVRNWTGTATIDLGSRNRIIGSISTGSW